MIRTLIAAAVLVCAGSSAAHAQRFTNITGQQLAAICGSSDKMKGETCNSYIEGVADTAEFFKRLRPQDGSKGAALPGYICVPSDTKGGAMRDVVVAWIRSNPEARDRQASGAVMDALYKTYGCK